MVADREHTGLCMWEQVEASLPVTVDKERIRILTARCRVTAYGADHSDVVVGMGGDCTDIDRCQWLSGAVSGGRGDAQSASGGA